MRLQPSCPHSPLFTTLFFSWALIIVLGTTLPWNTVHPHIRWSRIDWSLFHSGMLTPRLVLDMAINVVMYLPFGYLCRQWMGRTGGAMTFVYVMGMAVGLSCCTEFVQIFNLLRLPAMADVVMNLVGALLGFWAVASVQDESLSLLVSTPRHQRPATSLHGPSI